MKNRKLHPVFTVYAVAAAWIIYALIFPLYRISDLLFACVFSAVVYLLVRNFLCAKTEPGLKFVKTGDAGADETIKKGRDFINGLDRAKDTISNEKLSGQIETLKQTSVKIVEFVAKSPESAKSLDTFTDYYFPTALKLLNSYAEFQDKTGDPDGNVQNAMTRIEGVMESVIAAFSKQLDTLYENKSVDIRTDIDVLKTILARENL